MPYLRGGRGNVTSGYGQGPHLRGSRGPVTARRYVAPSLQAKVRYLERRMNRLKPEINEYSVKGNIVSIGGAGTSTTFRPVETLTVSSQFADTVIGDQFKLRGLTIRTAWIPGDAYVARIIVYVPRGDQDQAYTPGSGNEDLVSVPDISSYQILYDQVFTSQNNTSTHVMPFQKIYIPMNRMATFDRTNASLRSGSVKILVQTRHNTTPSTLGTLEYSLWYSNK